MIISEAGRVSKLDIYVLILTWDHET